MRPTPSLPLLRALLLAGILAPGSPMATEPRASTHTATTAARPLPEHLFDRPPDEARPWVYWYFMDGSLTREGMTADLESMKRVGIGGGIFLEVDLGIPRGPVGFMSPAWRELLGHAAREAERLGLQLALGSGPGWCGTGGPWVKPEQSMQHLVASETRVEGPQRFEAPLPRPTPRKPFFGEGTLTPETKPAWRDFYRDVAVVAFPTPAGSYRIPDVDEKALFHRAPYSSAPNVKPRLAADTRILAPEEAIPRERVMDLTSKLGPDGRLVWDVPQGSWTILRLGRTLTGQITRPAPQPGLGFESDKFDPAALDAHFESFVSQLLRTIGEPRGRGAGFVTLHFDSWEMSSQNWSKNFRDQFRHLRGYDPLPWLPAMFGHPIGGVETAERFLWDLRRTAQQLVLTNHVQRLRELGRRHGLSFSAEPYDMNPAGDLLLGGVADVPMCEFWSQNLGFSTEYSCFEAVSVAHTHGRPIVGAEAFTSTHDQWRQHPGSMKHQGDWAFCTGINRFVFHRFQHQPTLEEAPGMTFGYTHGVHWERTQTWWELSGAYNAYLARCQALLRHGLPVVDILYLDVEDAPAVFTPPPSALLPGLPDGRGYRFDGCAPDTLIERARAEQGRIVFPDGMTYRLLVLPRTPAQSPALLRKLAELAAGGVPIIGRPPQRTPGLEGYPQADAALRARAREIWSMPSVSLDSPAPAVPMVEEIYPDYTTTARRLAELGVPPDLEADAGADLRFTHRMEGSDDLYFVGNRTDQAVSTVVAFRVPKGRPELWDPIDGTRRPVLSYACDGQRTRVPLRFAPGQSYFVVFRPDGNPGQEPGSGMKVSVAANFPPTRPRLDLGDEGWTVTFDERRGGPAGPVSLGALIDWTRRPEDGVRHYSGVAVYRRTFDLPLSATGDAPFVLELGDVRVMARVHLNDRELGAVWCPPFSLRVPNGLLRPTGNTLRVEVANLWPNRLIGDSGLPAERRLARTTWNPYKPGTALLPSGLLGPVRLCQSQP